MITSLYENNVPMRFGVILYSTKFVKQIEMTSGGIYSSAKENDSQNEDISSLVICSFNCTLFYLSCIFKLLSTFILCAVCTSNVIIFVSSSSTHSVSKLFLNIFFCSAQHNEYCQ